MVELDLREQEGAAAGGTRLPDVVRLMDRDRPAVPPPGPASQADLQPAAPASRLARFGIRPLLLGADLLAVCVGVLGPELIASGVGVHSPLRKTAAFAAVFLALIWIAGLSRPRLSLSVLDDLPALAGRWLAAVAVAVLGQVFWSKTVWQGYVIDWQFLWGAVATGVAVVVVRAVSYGLVRRLRSRGAVAHPTLILGAGRVGLQVAEILRSHPEYGLRPIGFVDSEPILHGDARAPILGRPDALPELLSRYRVRNVVVAFSSMKESEMVSLIRACDRQECELFVVPRLFELHQVDGAMDNAWGLPLVRLRRATYRSRAWRVKRFADVLVSGLALFVLAPLMLALALAVRLDGGPGVLFRQERVGVDGRPFDLLKFRSLRPATSEESATTWNIAHDDRLSRLGRLLRRSSLDELPQLINILRGDMSLVGPRPERPHFVRQFRAAYPSYEARHRVPSGLTGWAQIHGLRGNTSIADRARFDNYYIENWSLWLDIKIILRTVTSLLKGSG